MSPKLYCAIPNSYVVNGATGLKGKYVKIISVNDWNGSIINVKVSNYGNGSYFYIILCLATNNISRWASGKLIAGNISGFSFYRVDKSIYMFIPDSIQDLYVTLDASMGNVSYGEEYENTIDLSNPITISWHNSLSTLDLGGLLENRLVKYKEMNLGANEIIDTGANTGLIHFKINTTSASCVFFCNSGSSNIMLITQNIDNYFTTNKSSNSGKIAIYKESDNGNILIKNLTAINYGTFVFYYI